MADMAATNVFGQRQHLFWVDFDPPIRPIPLQYWSDSIGNIGSIHLEVYWGVFHIGMGLAKKVTKNITIDNLICEPWCWNMHTNIYPCPK